MYNTFEKMLGVLSRFYTRLRPTHETHFSCGVKPQVSDQCQKGRRDGATVFRGPKFIVEYVYLIILQALEGQGILSDVLQAHKYKKKT